MNIFNKILRIGLNLPKTLYFNFKYLPINKAIKLPIFISRKVLLNKLKGEIFIDTEIKSGMINIGFGDVPFFDKKKSRTVWNQGGGLVIFKGKCDIGHGSKIAVGGQLSFGENFIITAESTIICDNHIEFGNDVLISWNCTFIDTDFHKLVINKEKCNPTGTIKIGNKVWICMNVIVLKDSILSDNTVVGAGSIINKKFFDDSVLIAGVPGKIIRNGIEWEM